MIVVDASVAAKWFLPKADQADAQALLIGKSRLLAPSLIRIEVNAAIIQRFRLSQLDESAARQACGEWEQILADGVIHLISDESLFNQAVEFAFVSRHALQDCFYLAAAASTGSELVTAHRTLVQRGRKVHADVHLLGAGHAH